MVENPVVYGWVKPKSAAYSGERDGDEKQARPQLAFMIHK
jgi:hypothetical protein